MNPRPWSYVVASLLVAARADAFGNVCLFETQVPGPATPGSVGDVRVYDESTGLLSDAPASLQAITLLALDLNGRTELTEHLPTAARLLEDLPAAARVVLPNRRGSIYHYQRVLPDGSAVFGLFQVPANGRARVLLERPGYGVPAVNDPILPRIATSPSGDALLLVTAVAAGGDVLEVQLGATPTIVDRTANVPPRRFYPSSLHLGDAWGTASVRRALLRFDRQPGAVVSAVSFGSAAAPTFVSGQSALSMNREWCVATAGSGPASLDVYVFGATGNAGKATTSEVPVTGAGFLPAATDGPHLAVADDGSAAAWRTERPVVGGGVSRECFVGHVEPLPSDPPQELSSDQLFLDTIDEVGVFVFKTPTRVQFGIGAQATPGANTLESTDFFQADIPATPGPIALTNLSLSSGDDHEPFLAVPTITPEHVTLLPSLAGTFFYDGENNPGERVLAVLDGQPAPVTVLPNAKGFFGLEIRGNWGLFSIRRSDGARPYELYRVPLDFTTPAALVQTLPDARYERMALRSDTIVGYVTVTPTGEFLDRVDVASGATARLQAGASFFGPTIGVTSRGGLAYAQSAAVAGPVSFAVWPADAGAATPIATTATGGLVLPGS